MLVHCFHLRASVKLIHKDKFLSGVEMNISDYFLCRHVEQDSRKDKIDMIQLNLWGKTSGYMYLKICFTVRFQAYVLLVSFLNGSE